MSRIVYHVRAGYVCKGDIQAIGERIRELQRRNADERFPEGHITFEEAIEEGRPDDSPFHTSFTWDEAQAAHERRLDQARYLLNSYSWEVVAEEGEKATVGIANVRIVDTVTKERFSVPSTFAASEPDYYSQMIDETNRLLRGAVSRLRILEGLSPQYVATIEKLIADLDQTKAKKKPAKPGKK
jgi:hypothetical protein